MKRVHSALKMDTNRHREGKRSKKKAIQPQAKNMGEAECTEASRSQAYVRYSPAIPQAENLVLNRQGES